jgi:hypothetical protein
MPAASTIADILNRNGYRLRPVLKAKPQIMTWAVKKNTPSGIVDEDRGELAIHFGSSAKTSDLIVDRLEAWWQRLPAEERDACTLLQIKADNGPESSWQRTPFLNRMVPFAGAISTPIQLL